MAIEPILETYHEPDMIYLGAGKYAEIEHILPWQSGAENNSFYPWEMNYSTVIISAGKASISGQKKGNGRRTGI